MASYRSSFQSDEKPVNKPGQWRASVSAPLCALCNKSVYPAEEVNAAGQKYHKLCLKCGKSFFLYLFINVSCFSFMQYIT